jgi:hypothetical protein
MLIEEPKSDLTRSKEVKVKIPVGHHVKLHSMKVLTGKQISDAVTEALDMYFATRPVGHQGFQESFLGDVNAP